MLVILHLPFSLPFFVPGYVGVEVLISVGSFGFLDAVLVQPMKDAAEDWRQGVGELEVFIPTRVLQFYHSLSVTFCGHKPCRVACLPSSSSHCYFPLSLQAYR